MNSRGHAPGLPSPTMQNEVKSGSSKGDIMPKKTVLERFRDFEEASSTGSNKPMTKGEIAIVVAERNEKRRREALSEVRRKKEGPLQEDQEVEAWLTRKLTSLRLLHCGNGRL